MSDLPSSQPYFRASGELRAATSAWNFARQHWRSPPIAVAAKLSADQEDFKRRGEEQIAKIGSGNNASRSNKLDALSEQWKARVAFQWSLAQAACALGGERPQLSEFRRYLKDAFASILQAQHSAYLAPEIKWTEAGRQPIDSSLDALKGLIAEALAELRQAALDCKPAWAPLEIALAAAQIERGLVWMIEDREPPSAQREIIIPLVAELNSGTKTGWLGKLHLFAVEDSTEIDGNQVLLFPDPVTMGPMCFDQQWQTHFQHAADWAAALAPEHSLNRSRAFAYSVEFCYESSAFQDDVVHEKVLPLMLQGPSASLAAGVLVRSLLEERQTSGNHFATGSIGRQGTEFCLTPIGDVYEKLTAYRKVLEFAGRMSIGVAGDDQDRAQARLIDKLVEAKPTWCHTAEQAYEEITGERAALERFALAELARVIDSLGTFIPGRLRDIGRDRQHESLQGAAIQGDELLVLEEMTMPQEARRLVPQHFAEPKQEPAMSLDSILKDYLALWQAFRTGQLPAAPRALHLFGGPGMGKTWTGLRWQLQLFRDWFDQQSSLRSSAHPAWFPLWVTAKEVSEMLALECDNAAELISQNLERRFGQAVPNSLADLRRIFARQVRQLIDQRRVVLIVDAWDERDPQHDAVLHKRLGQWNASCPLIITSRLYVESDHLLPPWAEWDLPGESWEIQSPGQAQDLNEFISCWFEPDWQTALQLKMAVRKSPVVLELMERTPQYAAIVCRFWESGAQTSAAQHLPDTRGELLDWALGKLLAHFHRRCQENKNETAQFGKIVSALRQDRNSPFVKLLQLLAFRTFDGQRWSFTPGQLQEKLLELQQEAASYELTVGRLLKDDKDVDDLQTAIGESGLFTKAYDGQLEVIHQAFAELLVAKELLRLFPSFDDQLPQSDPQAALQVALKFGVFEARWLNVWRCYAGLTELANPFALFFLNLRDRFPSTQTSWDVHRASSRVLLVCGGELKYQPGNPQIADLATSIAREAICKSSWQRSVPPELRESLEAACYRLTKRGYSQSLENISREEPSGVNSDSGPIADLHNSRIQLHNHRDRTVAMALLSNAGMGGLDRAVDLFLMRGEFDDGQGGLSRIMMKQDRLEALFAHPTHEIAAILPQLELNDWVLNELLQHAAEQADVLFHPAFLSAACQRLHRLIETSLQEVENESVTSSPNDRSSDILGAHQRSNIQGALWQTASLASTAIKRSEAAQIEANVTTLVLARQLVVAWIDQISIDSLPERTFATAATNSEFRSSVNLLAKKLAEDFPQSRERLQSLHDIGTVLHMALDEEYELAWNPLRMKINALINQVPERKDPLIPPIPETSSAGVVITNRQFSSQAALAKQHVLLSIWQAYRDAGEERERYAKHVRESDYGDGSFSTEEIAAMYRAKPLPYKPALVPFGSRGWDAVAQHHYAEFVESCPDKTFISMATQWLKKHHVTWRQPHPQSEKLPQNTQQLAANDELLAHMPRGTMAELIRSTPYLQTIDSSPLDADPELQELLRAIREHEAKHPRLQVGDLVD